MYRSLHDVMKNPELLGENRQNLIVLESLELNPLNETADSKKNKKYLWLRHMKLVFKGRDC